ncbi:hypothetical protein GW17_00037173, partial [Ensete ventricosum]
MIILFLKRMAYPSSLTLTSSPPPPLPCVGGGAACRRHGQPPLRQALLPSGSTSRAGDAALRGRLPLAAWLRALPTFAGAARAGASHAWGRQRMLAVTP